MKSSDIWEFISANIISLATVLLGIIVITLDQLNILPASIISPTILALLTLLATSEIVERKSRLSKIEENLTTLSVQLMDTTHGIKTMTFSSPDDAFNYLTQRTKELKSSLDEASISPTVYGGDELPARKRLEHVRGSLILSDKITSRYIEISTERRLKNAREYILEHRLNRFMAGFYARPPPDLPAISFVILDEEEVFARPPFQKGESITYFTFR